MTAHASVRTPDPAGRPAGQQPPGTVIETTALTKRYPGQVTALDELTVSVAPGVTGLIGANGAGKSTLIKILLGLLPPTKGRAMVFGHDCERGGEQIRSLTGYMPEHDCLLPDVTPRSSSPTWAGSPACRRPRPRSARRNRCVTSACTRSGTGRSAPTRPA